MTSADIESAGQHIYARLERELSPHLLYHSLYHTRDDVVPAAIRLATAAGLGQEEWLILVTAAMYHDAGFLLTYAQHEQGSIHIAREALPTFGYSPEQVANVIDVIAATRMPQKPNGFLQELICDADLNMLGRDDFMQLNRLLLQETRHFSNQPITEDNWYHEQTKFLEGHHFFTRVAHEFLSAGKARNLGRMRSTLASLNGSAGAMK